MSDDLKFQIQKLSSALEVSSNTIKNLERRLHDAQQIISIFEQEKKAWEQQKVLQEQIIKQQLQVSDMEKKKLEEEIIGLKNKLKSFQE